MNPDLPYLLAREVLDCICAALDEDSICECPCNAFVAHGQVAYDRCCEGMLWVAVDRLFVYEQFPQESRTAITCTPSLGAEMSVGLLRCAPQMDDDGTPPSSADLEDAAQQALREGAIVLSSVVCCLTTTGVKKRRFSVSGQNPLNGGCLGTLTRFSVELRLDDGGS